MGKFDITKFAGGAVAERINTAIQNVYENIADPNTEPDKARKLTIELVFKPDKNNRSDVGVMTVVKTSLQPRAAISSRMIVESDGKGGVQAGEWNVGTMMGQMEIPEEEGEKTEQPKGVIDLQAQRKAE